MSNRTKEASRDREYIAGLGKGLAVIEAFAAHQGALSVTEACRLAGISRAAARRCLRTLQQLGYAEHDGKYFRLAPRTVRLGYAYFASTPLTRVAQPVIEAASERTRHSMSLALLDGAKALIVARASIQRSLSAGLGVGSWLPAYCSANGRVLLSSLPDARIEEVLKSAPRPKLTPHTLTGVPEILKQIRLIRGRGYAMNDEEVELGLSTIAVAVRNRRGDVVASLSLSSIDGAAERKRLVRFLPELQAASLRLAGML